MAWGGGEVCITQDGLGAVTTQKSLFLNTQKSLFFIHTKSAKSNVGPDDP